MTETPVRFVGEGAAGLPLAPDLAWRGIEVTVDEIRHAREPPRVECNQSSARPMDIL